MESAYSVRRDTSVGGVLADVYSPATASRSAVVIAAGYRDEGYRQHMGCRFKDLPAIRSWAERIASAGMTAVTYSNRDPAADFLTVIREIGAERVGVWANSGNVPLALSALKAPSHVACAALLYGYMLDVAEAAAMFRFTNPALAFDEIDAGTPLFIVRAGRDEMPRLNESIDSFAQESLTRNMPVTIVNHAGAPHAFETAGDSEITREIVAQTIRFLQFHLEGRPWPDASSTSTT